MLLSYFSSSEAFGRKGVAVLDNKKRAPDSVISHALPKSAENVELVFAEVEVKTVSFAICWLHQRITG